MRPGRLPIDEERERLARREMISSPAEAIVAAVEEDLGPVSLPGDPVPPWEPKGEKETEPQETVRGEGLVWSPRPPFRAGGAPNHKTQLGRYGPDTGA